MVHGIYANIGGILMVNVTIYSIHGSYGIYITISGYFRQEVQSVCEAQTMMGLPFVAQKGGSS
jgi:hypothetical protein